MGLFLYEYNDFSSRIFFTNKILSDENNLDDILENNYNPENYVYINDNIIEENFNSKDRTSKLTYWSADLIKFETKSSSNQFLILSEIFYEDGWELFCNGTKQEIYQVNKIVRGLKVPSGINSFEMRFNPKEFYYGLFITRIAVALIILVFIYLLIRRYYGKKS